MVSRLRRLSWHVLVIAAMLGTQLPVNAFEWLQGPEHHMPPGPGGPPPPPMQPSHGPMDRAMHVGPPGKWWSDPRFVQILGLTPDQQKRMDEIFNQNRLKLIDLSAALQKEEAILEPLLSADRPDEPKILLQIDRVAQARAELEKANARMLLGLRGVLTPEQWKRLQADAPRGGHRPPPRS
jgi:Spy/CpxP family protein refolding chaperone